MSAGPAADGSRGNRLFGRTYGVERLAALSDGVFAIILTLLVLELKIPEVPVGQHQELVADLQDQIPSFVAWIVSFVLVARFWMVHHAVLRKLARCHLGTMINNFVVLAVMSLVPFGSGLIGTYEFDFLAIGIFSAIMAASGLSMGLFARHAQRNPHLHGAEGETDLGWHWRYHAFGIPLFAAFAVGVAWAHHPGTALSAWIIEPVVAIGLAWRQA